METGILNEEKDISWNCSVDLLASDTSQAMLGYKIEGTLSEDDCDFIMHYLSGQCEEQTAKGVNVTEVCNELLSDYLKDRDLYTKDFPIDIMHFGALMDEFKQKRALEEQENAREKANTPTWSEDLE